MSINAEMITAAIKDTQSLSVAIEETLPSDKMHSVKAPATLSSHTDAQKAKINESEVILHLIIITYVTLLSTHSNKNQKCLMSVAFAYQAAAVIGHLYNFS